jgi:putative hemolysin
MWSEILIILALILLNGVFAGAEIAVLSMRKTRLSELVEEGSRAARAVVELRDHPERFLATVQIGITVVGATAAAFGGAALAAPLEGVLRMVPGLEPVAQQAALALVVALVSFLSLVLGELVPKSLALRAGESYAMVIGRPLLGISWLARPVVAVLTGASNLVLRAFGDSTNFTETRMSRDELQQMVDEAAAAGSVDAKAGEIASRALDFANLDTYTLMVPRAQIKALPKDATASQVLAFARADSHARVPVYEGGLDEVVGFVNLREALAAMADDPSFTLAKVLHPVVFVPDSASAPVLLRQLQLARTHIAVVVDELGTLLGLVTIEDLLEELVGEIVSENDAPHAGIVRESDGVWCMPADTALHDIARQTSLEPPETDDATIGGLALRLAGRVPPVGEMFDAHQGFTIEIVDATPRRLKRVRLRRVSES